MTTQTRSILITSASGNIGKELIPLLLSTPASASYTVVLPTRDGARLKSQLPKSFSANVVVAEGDTTNATWLEGLMKQHSVDTVFSNFAHIEELILTLNLWAASTNAGVKHLIFVSAAGDYSPQAVTKGDIKHVDAAHVAYKFFLEQKLFYGSPSFTFTILGPTLFFSNETRSKETMLKGGFFHEPIGTAGCSRVDPADIALAAVKSIEDFGRQYNGKKISIGSRELYTGDEVARLWSDALGKEIKPRSADAAGLAEYEESLTPYMGRAFGRDLALMYKQFDAVSFGLTDDEYAAQVEFLGKEPSSYPDFVKKTAAQWKAEA